MTRNRRHPFAVGGGWVKSSYSNNAASCVEVRRVGADVQVRDSKNADPALLAIPASSWTSFVTSVR